MSTEITSPLIQQICLRQAHLRSIQVEQDLYNPHLHTGYVLTPQVLSAIGRITTPTASGKPPRAWTITGAYGAGKSYFAVYLMNLANSGLPAHAESLAALRHIDPLLAESCRTAFATHQQHGLLTIAVTGFRAPLQICLQQGCLNALKTLPPTAARQTLINTITQWDENTRSRTIIEDLTALTATLQTPEFNYAGLLLLLDELGKPLEYAAAHPEQADIYLLQELAEFAARNAAPVYLIGILHQAFEGYAALLASAAQREWAKIQGRFEDLIFQEPPAQQIRLTANAIQHDLQISDTALGIEQPENLSAWCPPLITVNELQKLTRRAYPLHVTSLVALPYLFRRLAQNERSLFAFLLSNEPNGFQEFLSTHIAPETLRLYHLFEYLIANFQARLYATNRSRTLTETVERLETAAALSPLDRRVLQTVGLLHWLSETTPLTATQENLITALHSAQDTPAQILASLQSLQKRSLLVYRRFNHTYAIWQGSDIDIESELRQAEHRLSTAFSLAEVVQNYLPPRPLVAQKHSYETGTLRYFEMRFVDARQASALPQTPHMPGASGLILVALPMHPQEAADFETWAQQPEHTHHPNRIFGIVTRTARLTDLARELRQLHWVRENTPALRDDPVARRELRARLQSIEQLIRQELEKHLSLHRIGATQGCLWFYEGKQQTAQRALSSILSEACGKLYPQSPKIWNEMLNRRELTPQAAGARRNLIQAMLQNPEQPKLGIDGFPPERSMYETFLQKGKLHQPTQEGSTWHFCKPLDKSDPLNLLPAWEFLEEKIFHAPASPRPLLDLFSELSAPPYGVTDGVFPVLLCAFMQVHQHEVTLYRENTLLPEPAAPDWEVLLRRPDLFAIAGCRLEGGFERILTRFAAALQVQPAAMPIVRSLIRRLKTLPDYTWRTRTVSTSAAQLRNAVETAYSPEKFLLTDLPSALDLPAFTTQNLNEKQIEDFFARLNRVLTELSNAFPTLRELARDQLLQACNWQTGEAGWLRFVALASEWQLQVTHPQLLPLLKRAAMTGEHTVILESVLAYVSERPLHVWTDADAARFPAQADTIGKIFQAELQRRSLQAALTPQQQHTAQNLTAQLRPLLEQAAADPIVLKAALQQLLDELSN